MKIQPTRNYLLVQIRDLGSDTTTTDTTDKTKLLLPEGVKLQPHGVVVAHGPQCEFGYRVNDKLLFNTNSMIRFEGSDEVIIPETAVFGKYVDETP